MEQEQSTIPATERLGSGDLFAVYGSLREGFNNYKNLELETRAKYVGNQTIPGTLYSLGAFPGYKPEGDTPVVVEIYELVDLDLGLSLDRLEGYMPTSPENSFYIRTEVDTGDFGKVHVYVYNGSTERLKEVESGDWKEYKSP